MNYAEILSQLGISFITEGVWTHYGRTDGIAAGWKLHLSSVQKEVPRLLNVVVPILCKCAVSFKIARDSKTLGLLNEGAMGFTQVGKFATIYPCSAEDSVRLSEELIPVLEGFHGPRIVTDLHLKYNLYVRFGPYNPISQRDRLGQIDYKYQKYGDVLVDTSYKVPFVIPENVENPFSKYLHLNNADDCKLWGPGFLVIRAISTNAKGNVYLAIDLRSQENVGFVLIKEGRYQCLSDDYGRAMKDRIEHQYHCLKTLHGRAPVPEPITMFEENGNTYLAMEYIEGGNLLSLVGIPYSLKTNEERKTILRYLLLFAEAVQSLHASGFIHRDLSPRNVIVSEGGVILVDLELSAEYGKEQIPYGKGTPGFISPQQEIGQKPTASDDIFSMGSCFYFLLTSVNPEVVLWSRSQESYQLTLERSGVPQSLSKLVSECLSDDPRERPPIQRIIEVLLKESDSNKKAKDNVNIQSTWYNSIKEYNYKDIAYMALKHLCTQAFVDSKTGLWLSSVMKKRDTKEPLREIAGSYELYRSANRGVAGVVYSISKISNLGIECPCSSEIVSNAVEWLLEHFPTRDDQLPGLHFGEAGVAVAICEAIKAGFIKAGSWTHGYLEEVFSEPPDWPDITHGAAGQGLACLACADAIGMESLENKSHSYAEYLINCQKEDGSWAWPDGVEGMKGTTYTGFAHGVAGIAYFLEIYRKRFSNRDATRSCLRGVDWLIQNAISRNSTTVEWTMKGELKDIWKWWCHGGPGIALTFMKMYENYGEEEYLEIAKKALLVHRKETMTSNLSLCHGIGGLAYIYMVAAATFKESIWSDRAKYLIDNLIECGRKKDGGISWLVEDPFVSTSDLFVGNAGIALLLAEYGSSYEVHNFPLL